MIENSNFKFLRNIDSYLYSLAIDAEKQIFIDNDTVMYKLRKMSEKIIQNIFTFENINEVLSKNHYKNLNYLYQNNYIGNNLYFLLDEIRKSGNDFVHGHDINLNRDNILVKESIKSMYLITAYYCKKYIDSQMCIENFKDYYIDDTRKFIIIEKYNNLTDYQNEFLNKSLVFLSDRLATYIIKNKIVFGSIKDLGYVSFDEFFEYYMELLSLLIVEDEKNVEFILQLKEICKFIVSSYDGNDINYYIARMLYNDIFDSHKN